jgi:outer membrane murein-binding lipoprotein Lpp
VCLTIEVALLISGVSVAFGIFAGISNIRRNQKIDDKKDATEMTTVIVKLENISNGIAEIKSEMTNVKADIKESRERLIKVEESAKQAHKRIDEITKYKRPGDSELLSWKQS